MRIDRQTLAWINREREWMIKLRPNYAGGLAETAQLPDSDKPTMMFIEGTRCFVPSIYLDRWIHSRYLIDNKCGCDVCLGIGDDWGYIPRSWK